MSSRFRSSSLGAVPHKKPLSRSRAASNQPAPLEVRCACQFFQSDSLIPERINPIGSRPPSRLSDLEKPINTSKHNILESTVEEEDLTGSVLSFGKASVPDYYGDTSTTYRIDSHDEPLNFSQHLEHETFRQINQPLTFDNRSHVNQPLSFDNRSIPSIEIESYTRNYPVLNLSQNIRPNQGQFSSQKSLDRYSTSQLLNRYRPMSQSHAPSLQGSSVDVRAMPKMTKTVSFDYGKPTHKRSSIANENPNFDQYHRMSPMVFPIRDRLQKLERMHDRDHEYEPIGEPQLDETVTDLDQPDSQKRKTSDTDAGNEKKFLRTPTQDSEDNISAQDFQDEIESRFFAHGIEPIVDDEAHAVHQENTFDEAVIIDESPVKREMPRKRNFITSAQEKGKNFNKKIKAQADIFKNKMKKKPKEKPVAVEIAQENIEPPVDEVEGETQTIIETIETVNVSSAETPGKSKSFFKKPTMPKFSRVERPSMPDLKLGGRFSNFGKKLGRSKSMKEESIVTDTTSYTSPEVSTAEPTKKKFDFGTYPRMIRDKFKKQKAPERSDQSVRSETPPTIEFTNASGQFMQRGPVASRWPEYDSESGKYQQFNSESDLDRESSIERRMRLDYERSTEEREDFEIVKRLMNEEQRQLDEMDRENQEIHLMAQQERYKKPMVHQESDVGSEEDKLLWSGMLNKDTAKDDFEDGNALRFDDGYKYSLDQYKNESDINRSYTPQTNQETQSSGSSGTRRRKGVLDDDEDYFLREHRISNEIHLGDYISSAIKEGLSTPEDNALAQMGGFDRSFDEAKHELTPEPPTRSLKRKNRKVQEEPVDDDESSWQKQNASSFKDFYKTFPPDRPVRKQKKSECEDEDLGDEIDLSEEQVPDSYNADDLIEDMSNRELFYHQQILKGLDHPDLIGKEDFDNDLDFNMSNLPIPPTPPRRRKKKIRSPIATLRNDGNNQRAALAEQNVQVFRYDQKFVPLAREEKFTPTPPRRTRSRSQISAHTLDDADSFKHDSIEAFTAFNVQDKENGYAQVRKDLPPRPVRRKRSTKSLGDRQFATMPHMKRESETPPPRPAKKYSTIIPSKPPRRKSSGSLVEISQTTKNDDDYEEILDSNQEFHDNAAVLRLKSGEIVKRMKDRPLPPPPRPKREHKKQKKDDGDDDKLDRDDGAEKVIGQLSIETDLSDEQLHEVKETLPRQDSDFSEPEKVVEVEVSTQTDPVPDEDFVCDEDEDCDIDEFLSSDGKMKTLEDILKEEQEAELERARQLAEAENLSRGIQRFRDSSQRSMSERSRTSGDRSRSLSRPITPSAVVVERKKSSPIIFQSQEQTLTEAGLFIHPITYDDYGIPHSDEELNNDPIRDNLDVNNNFDEVPAVIRPAPREPSPPPTVTFNQNDDEGLDIEMQRKIEEMIESVMSSAEEEVEWLRASNEEIESAPVESSVRVEISQPEEAPEQYDEPPLPPPRRKSTVVEDASKKEDLPAFDESQIVTATTRTQQHVAPEEVKENNTVNDVEVCEEPCVQRFVKRPVIHEEGHVVQDHRHSESAAVQDHAASESIQQQLSNHLHLSSLEIDNLSVSSLNAGRILASEIDSNTIVTGDLEVKGSHNVPAPRSIEFPPGFIDEIVARVRSASQQPSESLQTEEQPPARPPLPAQFFSSTDFTSNIPPSFYQLRDPSEDEAVHPQTPHRRKKQQIKRKDSTSEEDRHREQRNRNRGGDQSVMGLGGQFARACGSAIKESGENLMAVLRASCKDEKQRDLHIALVILIIIVAGLVLMGMGGDKSVQIHHWDFFNPPDNHGR